MGNSIGGKRRRARVMTVDGATYKYRPPAAAADALRGHPGHHLLESDEVRRLGVRARPLDPDAPLKPGKLYFLVHMPNLSSCSSGRRRAPPLRTWSGALHYAGGAGAAATATASASTTTSTGAGERLESLMLARRSASDVAASVLASPGSSAASLEAAGDGAVRLRVRLPKADVQRLVEDSRDAAEAAERIMQLCVARDQQQQLRRHHHHHRSAPGTPLLAPAIITSSAVAAARKRNGQGSSRCRTRSLASNPPPTS